MQLEVWKDTNGNLQLLLPSQDSAAGWELIGHINVIPATPQLATMEIADDRDYPKGSNPED